MSNAMTMNIIIIKEVQIWYSVNIKKGQDCNVYFKYKK